MRKKAFYNIISSLVLQSVMLITNFVLPHLIIHNYGSSINGLITSITQFLSFVVLLESGIGGVVLVKYYDALATKDSIKMSQIYKESKKFFNIIAYITIIYVIILCIILRNAINVELPFSERISEITGLFSISLLRTLVIQKH